MTIAFSRTRQELAAMVIAKLATTSSTANLTLVYEAVDLRLKEMHRRGIFWRKVAKVPLQFTLSAATATGSASNDVLFPIAMTAVNFSNDDPIEIVGVKKYAEIENKTYSGVPTMALHLGSSSFKFWPVPISNTTINLTYEKVADDTADGVQPDVEVSMLRWLKDIIAYDLGDEFGKEEQTMIRWERDCMRAERNIRALNVEHIDNVPVEFCNY